MDKRLFFLNSSSTPACDVKGRNPANTYWWVADKERLARPLMTWNIQWHPGWDVLLRVFLICSRRDYVFFSSLKNYILFSWPPIPIIFTFFFCRLSRGNNANNILSFFHAMARNARNGYSDLSGHEGAITLRVRDCQLKGSAPFIPSPLSSIFILFFLFLYFTLWSIHQQPCWLAAWCTTPSWLPEKLHKPP